LGRIAQAVFYVWGFENFPVHHIFPTLFLLIQWPAPANSGIKIYRCLENVIFLRFNQHKPVEFSRPWRMTRSVIFCCHTTDTRTRPVCMGGLAFVAPVFAPTSTTFFLCCLFPFHKAPPVPLRGFVVFSASFSASFLVTP